MPSLSLTLGLAPAARSISTTSGRSSTTPHAQCNAVRPARAQEEVWSGEASVAEGRAALHTGDTGEAGQTAAAQSINRAEAEA
jgi:hypothetical protein